MNFLNKAITTFVVLAFILSSFSARIIALTISPATGTKTAGSSENLSITANPQAGEISVKLDLVFTNATVVSFTPNSAFITLPECNGSSTTSTRVCVSVAKTTGDLTSGELLGTVRVTWGSTGTATIVATDNNWYGTASTQRTDSGTKATYTIGSIPNTPLIEKAFDQYLLLSMGAALIFLGLYLRKSIKNSRNERANY